MTEVLRLAVACVALFGVTAKTGSADRVEILFEQVARLGPADRQRFLLWVESRLNWANTMVLSAKEAAVARDTLYAQVRRETFTGTELRRLLHELNRRENEALEQLTGQYRLLHTLRVFRNSRDPGEQLQQAWLNAQTAWHAAGRPLAHQHELLYWLTAAIEASSASSVAPLPAVPSFTTDSLASLLPELLLRGTLPMPSIPEDMPASPPTHPAPRTKVAGFFPLPCPTLPASAQSAFCPAEVLEPMVPTIRKRVAAFAVGGDRTPTLSELETTVFPGASNTIAPIRCAWKPDEPTPTSSPTRIPPRETASLCALPVSDTAGMLLVAASPSTASIDSPAIQKGIAERSAGNVQVLPGRPASPLKEISPAEDTPATARPDRSETPHQPEITLAGSDYRMPRTQPKPPVAESYVAGAPNGRTVYGSPTELSERSGQIARSDRAVSGRSPSKVIRSEPRDSTQTRPKVEVNLGELRTRISGTNMALRALEAELYEARYFGANDLAPLVTRLHSLALRVGDMRLFRAMVPEETRRLIDVSDSPRPAITLAASRIAEARQRVSDGQYAGTETERRAELRRLDELSRRLAQIANTLDQ